MAVIKKQVIVAIILGFLLWISPRTALAGTFRDNFDDGDLVGWKPNIPAGISIINGKLQFRGADSLIVKVGSPSWEGYSLEARVKIAEFMGGGWFSTRILQSNTGDRTGYYELRLAQGGIVSALYVNDHCVESFQVPIVVEENLWHSVKINPSNGKVSFYLDEILIAQFTDVGLSGYADMCSTKGTHVYVDDVGISGPNIPDTGPSGPNSFAIESRSKLAITWGEVKKSKAPQLQSISSR